MDIAFIIFVICGAGCLYLLKKFMFTKDETSILRNILYDKGNLDEENKHRFVELDQEIAEKEKELNSLKELQKKEKKLNDLNNQIGQYSGLSEILGEIGNTMAEIKAPSITPIIMSAEEVKEKQKNTHWSEDKKLLKVYEESKQKALKEIEQLIQETIVGNKNIVEYPYLDTYNYMYETKQDLPIFNLKENVPTETAQTEFPQEIIKDLELLGYKAQQKERVFKKVIRVEW